ncbi:fatty acid-binding protein, liver-like [Puntigrus tetrazona]|uniref:fatty acid-binding protein, liver n=1 Tax=Puntigrus tetrazona TaxID=1606681 RepID=UPI001C8A92AB|nr:fatty acid-binding protein, liver [Puntigrus tetrazona]XP_043089088.1 fatty acid-binding protein, liver-like [Puntigrus tetrazona]
MAVDFSGSWKLFEQENAEEFLRAVSAPTIYIKMMNEVKPLTTIQQNGDEFIICVKTPLRSNTNIFTIGTESEFNTMDGQKIKATARLIDGKIVIESEKFTHVREIQGEEMIETFSAGSATLIRRSRRV